MRDRLDFPTLRQLRAFEAVARLNSIGAAAGELGLSQPAVSQMVAQTEAGLAASLLERRRTGSYLTTLGSVLWPRVQRLFAAMHSALCDLPGRTRDDKIGAKQNYRRAYPVPDRDCGVWLVRCGGSQARDIAAHASPVCSRSRAGDSKRPVSTNGPRIGANLASP